MNTKEQTIGILSQMDLIIRLRLQLDLEYGVLQEKLTKIELEGKGYRFRKGDPRAITNTFYKGRASEIRYISSDYY